MFRSVGAGMGKAMAIELADIKRLHAAILDVTEEHDPALVIAVLWEALGFELSQLCCDCRRRVGEDLTRKLPFLLEAAEQAADPNAQRHHSEH
jgi:hypothetical protein